MDKRASIAGLLAELAEMCPLGFAIALHIKYNAPTFMFQSFPEKWAKHYSKNGLVIRDPAVHWAFGNTGYIRWRDLAASDTTGIMDQARLYGLTYGFTSSIHNDRSRSLAGFARADRDYLDVEIDEINDRLIQLDMMTAGIDVLSKKDRDALLAMSIRLTHQ